MKKSILAVVFCCMAVFGFSSIASSQYLIGQLTNSPGEDYIAGINASGQVVWYGSDGNDNEIFLYNGMVILQLSDNNYDDFDPKINNSGQVAWSGFDGNDYEIFFYDGTQVIQLTDNDFDDYVYDINVNGQVIWVGFDGNDYEVFLYNGTQVIQLTDNEVRDDDPKINDAAHVTWNGFDDNDYEIFLYDGAQTIQLTDNAYDDRIPQINASGQVVWYGFDGNDEEIFLYDGEQVIQLTDNSYNDVSPQINVNGYVVWRGGVGEDWNIFLYNGITTTALTTDGSGGGDPQINGKGHVVWHGRTGSNNEVFLYDGSIINRVTNNSYNDILPRFNENDQIAWYGTDAYDIFLATKSDKPVVLRAPNGGFLPSGGKTTLAWAAVPEAVSFKVSYSIDNGATWKPASAGLVTTTAINWDVPLFTKNKKNCLVKVAAYDAKGKKVGVDKSDAPFTTEVLTITDPINNDTCISGQSCSITWNRSPYIDAQTGKLSYSTDGGLTWKMITDTITKNDRSYSLWAPAVKATKTNCKVKLVYKNTSGKTVGTATSGKFAINKP